MRGSRKFQAASGAALILALATTPSGAETLREAMLRAYQTNPTLTGARAGQRSIDENVAIEKADGRPNARSSADYTEYVNRPSVFTPRRNVSANAQVNVPLYSGGAVRNAINAAKLRVQAGQNDLRGTESSVFARVVAAYMDVIRDSAIVTFNRQNVVSLETNFRASNDRFEVGDVTRTDVAQSDSRLALARADLQTAEAQLIASKENYIALVGVSPDNLQTPPPLPGLPATPEAAVAVALTDNPDILAANKARDAAHYDVKVAKAQAAPRVSAFARGDYVDYLGSEKGVSTFPSTNPTAKDASVGVSVTLPLYQGGRPGALARQGVARESQAIEDQVRVERDVISQTRSAYASWQASLHTIESTRSAVSSTSLSLEGVRAENSAGTRTILDILNAEQEAVNARVQLVVAERNAYVAAFSLLAAMGHAEARDLNLDGGALYDPQINYKRVNDKWFDFDFDGTPQATATRTVDSPTQNAILNGASKP
ncbi:MAG: TolC family outer membrane protein [Sphingobium sp.]